MDKAVWELCAVIVAIICIHLASHLPVGMISGRILPANKVDSIIAIRGNDSVISTSSHGAFEMKLRPGNWKIIVTGGARSGNVVWENVFVSRGQQINLGEIRLTE